MQEFICIVCPKGCRVQVSGEDVPLVTGNSCKRGKEYVIAELTNPLRTVTSTVKVTGSAVKRCPVKTNAPIPKNLVFEAVRALDGITLTPPIRRGDVIFNSVCGTGVCFVASKTIDVYTE